MVFGIDDIVIVGVLAASAISSAYFSWQSGEEQKRANAAAEKANKEAQAEAKKSARANLIVAIVSIAIAVASLIVTVFLLMGR